MLQFPVHGRLITLGLASMLLMPRALPASEHVVPETELRAEATRAAEARKQNVDKLQAVFHSPDVRARLAVVRIDAARLERAIPTLSDAELASLAARADKYRADVAGGALSNQEITYILIALATAVIVLILVH